MDTSPRPPTLLALPSYLAGHVARISRRPLVERLSAHGLRPPHFAVLAALGDFGALPQHELADRLRLKRSHLVGYLDELEAQDLVERRRDADDRRRQFVVLADRGRPLLAELAAESTATEAHALHALEPHEQATLVALLRRVVDADAADDADADDTDTRAPTRR